MKSETRLAIAAIAFPALVALSKFGRQAVEVEWQSTLLSVLPLLPAAVLGWLGFEHMRRQDEMHRRIQLEAGAFAFAVTLTVTMAYLFLHGSFTLPTPQPATYILLLGGSWFAGLLLSWRRYR